VTLNLDDENERETFRKLIFTADVLLETQRPGVPRSNGVRS
jgi:crotonobetainyl-CoA:carnitine CoA-transferase CaiB-like acyl-CoA transferase